MATFFGEILPVISRAVDDDEEEESSENLENAVKLRWNKQAKEDIESTKDKKLACDAFILAVGSAATGFTQTYLTHRNYEIIGGVFCGMRDGDVNTFGQTSPTDKSCYIYRKIDNPLTFVCECNVDVKAEHAHSFINQLLLDLDLTAAYVTILCSSFTSEFKSEIPTSDMNPPFLRALKTVQFLGTPLAPYLEQPNVVTGLPALALSYCHIHKVKATLYICYTDSIHLDSPTMRSFLPLLETTPIKDNIEKNTKANETLKKIVDMHAKHSTLYL